MYLNRVYKQINRRDQEGEFGDEDNSDEQTGAHEENENEARSPVESKIVIYDSLDQIDEKNQPNIHV